jgi:hypothetical protein
VNLDHAQAEAQDVGDVRHDVGGVAGMKAAAGDQAFGIVAGVVGDELVDFGTESDDFGSDIVDEGGAVDSAAVEIIEEGLGRAAIFFDVAQVGAVALNEFERLRFEARDRIDVDVAVGDQRRLLASGLIQRDFGIYGAGPAVDSSAHGLNFFVSLLTQPVGDAE